MEELRCCELPKSVQTRDAVNCPSQFKLQTHSTLVSLVDKDIYQCQHSPSIHSPYDYDETLEGLRHIDILQST
eukprot:scaffold3944_cov74-Cyclotella_meneghiniana.AAC.2